jgi:hypothetical protein
MQGYPDRDQQVAWGSSESRFNSSLSADAPEFASALFSSRSPEADTAIDADIDALASSFQQSCYIKGTNG